MDTTKVTVINEVKKPRRQPSVAGTRPTQSGTFRGAREPSRDIFVFRVEKGTIVSDIKQYIIDNEVQVRDIQCVSNENAMYCSYKVEIGVSNLSKVLESDFWPTGVNVRRFRQPKGNRNVNVEPI